MNVQSFNSMSSKISSEPNLRKKVLLQAYYYRLFDGLIFYIVISSSVVIVVTPAIFDHVGNFYRDFFISILSLCTTSLSSLFTNEEPQLIWKTTLSQLCLCYHSAQNLCLTPAISIKVTTRSYSRNSLTRTRTPNSLDFVRRFVP
jgi:hypothetical protein